jgi:ketosteroid isomerase-like protein
MSSDEMSRRTMFGSATLTGVALLADGGEAHAALTGSSSEAVVRAWYGAWEKKDWDQANALSTDDFNFTSPNDDDHISKAEFKKNCWDTQIAFIKAFDLELVMAKDDDVLVKYTCQTMNGKTFSNVEYFRVRDRQVASLRCFFGGKMTYPSSVSAQ